MPTGQLLLELELGSDPISGRLRDDDGSGERAFAGDISADCRDRCEVQAART
jgi:hypothetical protein